MKIPQQRSIALTQKQAGLVFLLIEEELERSPGRSRRDELARLARKLPGLWLRPELEARWKTLVGWGEDDDVDERGAAAGGSSP